MNVLCVLKCSHFTSVRTMPRALLVKVKKDELFFSQMRAIWLGARPTDESWEQASKNS